MPLQRRPDPLSADVQEMPLGIRQRRSRLVGIQGRAGRLDIVCPVRPGDQNEPLRYAIRSWESNLQFDKIWIVGHKPNWLTDEIGYIPGNPTDNGHHNVYANILIASQHQEVSVNYLAVNDDFFITEPVSEARPLYRGTLAEHLNIPRVKRGGWWKDSLTTTQVCLQAHGIADPISYELHVPLPVDKVAMAETLQQFQHVTPANPPQWRTLYGNLHGIGGKQHQDVKAYHGGALHRPFHSTEPRSFPAFEAQLAAMFPELSRYERVTIAAMNAS